MSAEKFPYLLFICRILFCVNSPTSLPFLFPICLFNNHIILPDLMLSISVSILSFLKPCQRPAYFRNFMLCLESLGISQLIKNWWPLNWNSLASGNEIHWTMVEVVHTLKSVKENFSRFSHIDIMPLRKGKDKPQWRVVRTRPKEILRQKKNAEAIKN